MYKISEEAAQLILSTLAEMPYKNVFKAVEAIQSIEKIEDEEEKDE